MTLLELDRSIDTVKRPHPLSQFEGVSVESKHDKDVLIFAPGVDTGVFKVVSDTKLKLAGETGYSAAIALDPEGKVHQKFTYNEERQYELELGKDWLVYIHSHPYHINESTIGATTDGQDLEIKAVDPFAKTVDGKQVSSGFWHIYEQIVRRFAQD